MDLKPYRAPLVRVRREGKAPPNRSREPASREAVVFLGEDFGLREEVCGETIEVLSKERLLGLDGLNPIALRTDGPAISYGKWINATDATQKKNRGKRLIRVRGALNRFGVKAATAAWRSRIMDPQFPRTQERRDWVVDNDFELQTGAKLRRLRAMRK